MRTAQRDGPADARAATRRQTLLVIDDDPEFCEMIHDGLAVCQEFGVRIAATARAGISACAEGGDCDLVILDVGLPDMDGREACKTMRRNGFRAPIILLTGETSHADEVLGLDAGANDYVTKPVRFPVLLARIRAQLRQNAHNVDAVLSLGPFRFKPAEKLLIKPGGAAIRLPNKETLILKFLYRAPSHLASRDELLRDVWRYNSNVSTHTVETHIYRLRQKIEPDPANATLLKTVSRGYRLAL